MARQRVVERSDVGARAAPLLAEALPSIAHPQIRNRGTVGGSIAHADPSAELPAVMLALEARFRAQGSTGERSIPAAEFFKGMLETALAPGVLLSEAGKLLAGQSPSEELLRAAADAAATRDIDPPSDIHASAAYRRQLARVLTRRALARAFERAGSALYAPEAP